MNRAFIELVPFGSRVGVRTGTVSRCGSILSNCGMAPGKVLRVFLGRRLPVSILGRVFTGALRWGVAVYGRLSGFRLARLFETESSG